MQQNMWKVLVEFNVKNWSKCGERYGMVGFNVPLDTL